MVLINYNFASKSDYVTAANLPSTKKSIFSEQLHQNVQVQCVHVSASKLLRAIPALGQLLLPLPPHPSGALKGGFEMLA